MTLFKPSRMTVLYHPEFAGDIRSFAARYAAISPRLETRFRSEVDIAITAQSRSCFDHECSA